jgi:hypothetical protein
MLSDCYANGILDLSAEEQVDQNHIAYIAAHLPDGTTQVIFDNLDVT